MFDVCTLDIWVRSPEQVSFEIAMLPHRLEAL